jgi:hypothetical protein
MRCNNFLTTLSYTKPLTISTKKELARLKTYFYNQRKMTSATFNDQIVGFIVRALCEKNKLKNYDENYECVMEKLNQLFNSDPRTTSKTATKKEKTSITVKPASKTKGKKEKEEEEPVKEKKTTKKTATQKKEVEPEVKPKKETKKQKELREAKEAKEAEEAETLKEKRAAKPKKPMTKEEFIKHVLTQIGKAKSKKAGVYFYNVDSSRCATQTKATQKKYTFHENLVTKTGKKLDKNLRICGKTDDEDSKLEETIKLLDLFNPEKSIRQIADDEEEDEENEEDEE